MELGANALSHLIGQQPQTPPPPPPEKRARTGDEMPQLAGSGPAVSIFAASPKQQQHSQPQQWTAAAPAADAGAVASQRMVVKACRQLVEKYSRKLCDAQAALEHEQQKLEAMTGGGSLPPAAALPVSPPPPPLQPRTQQQQQQQHQPAQQMSVVVSPQLRTEAAAATAVTATHEDGFDRGTGDIDLCSITAPYTRVCKASFFLSFFLSRFHPHSTARVIR